MTPRRLPVSLALVATLGLSACATAEDAAQEAGDAAGSVAAEAAESAGDEAVEEAIDAVAPENGSAVDPLTFAAAAVLDGTTILDVRTPEEFAAAHLPGAVNIPLAAPDFEEQIAALDPGGTYAVYCRTDARSGQAIEIMLEQGFTRAYHLDGGIEAYLETGLDTVTGP